MNDQKIILESLAMDLKRVSLGLQRGSIIMAERFAQEVFKRKSEVNLNEVKPYIATLLSQVDKKIKNLKDERTAEDILMYSTLFQNYTQKLLK